MAGSLRANSSPLFLKTTYLDMDEKEDACGACENVRDDGVLYPWEGSAACPTASRAQYEHALRPRTAKTAYNGEMLSAECQAKPCVSQQPFFIGDPRSSPVGAGARLIVSTPYETDLTINGAFSPFEASAVQFPDGVAEPGPPAAGRDDAGIAPAFTSMLHFDELENNESFLQYDDIDWCELPAYAASSAVAGRSDLLQGTARVDVDEFIGLPLVQKLPAGETAMAAEPQFKAGLEPTAVPATCSTSSVDFFSGAAAQPMLAAQPYLETASVACATSEDMVIETPTDPPAADARMRMRMRGSAPPSPTPTVRRPKRQAAAAAAATIAEAVREGAGDNGDEDYVGRDEPGASQERRGSKRTQNGRSSGMSRGQARADVTCQQCGTNKTPQWRNIPEGRVCNACGVRYMKNIKKIEDRRAARTRRRQRGL